MNNLLIGFGHKARQGKDTACLAIQREFGDKYNIVRVAFADFLKKEANQIGFDKLSEYYGIPLDPDPYMDDPLCQTCFGKQPKLLQAHGDGQRNAISPWYWVRQLEEYVKSLQGNPIVLVSDVRYFTEALFIKENKGYLVNVKRPGFITNDRDPNHISETQLDGFDKYDFAIESTSVEDLTKSAIEVFSHILELEGVGKESDYYKDVFDSV